MIIIFALLALTLFFYFQNQRIKRMEEHHERSKERFEKLLETLRKLNKDQPESEKETGKKTE